MLKYLFVVLSGKGVRLAIVHKRWKVQPFASPAAPALCYPLTLSVSHTLSILRYITSILQHTRYAHKHNDYVSKHNFERVTRGLLSPPEAAVLSAKFIRDFSYDSNMQAYIGVPVHNCIKYTIAMLDSIFLSQPYKLIVVDNGSTDETAEFLKELEKKGHIVIRNETNPSVSVAWNQIIYRTMQDPEMKYLFILNNDIILESTTLNRMIEFLGYYPEYVLVCGMNSINPSGDGDFFEPALYFSCFMMTRECIEKVGLFDENYEFGSFNDNDYLEKMDVAGCKSCTVRGITFFHYGARTFSEGGLKVNIKSLIQKNMNYFEKKWGKKPDILPS